MDVYEFGECVKQVVCAFVGYVRETGGVLLWLLSSELELLE